MSFSELSLDFHDPEHPLFLGFLDNEQTIRIFRLEHEMWKTYQMIKKSGLPYPLPCLMGRWHYFYHNERKQMISLICTDRGFMGFRGSGRKIVSKISGHPYMATRYWEISSYGTVKNCEDAEELFNSRKEAEVRILQLLK